MPAKSKTQQRLFGMVRAYQKGEFKGPRGLRNRIARISSHISDADASHFAQTPHDGLPEKKEAADSPIHRGGAFRRSSVCSDLRGRIGELVSNASLRIEHALDREKRAQAYLRPDQAAELASFLSDYAPPVGAMSSSVRRRSFLSRIVPGVLVGAAVGGLGAGGLGAYVAHRAARTSKLPADEIADKVREAALRTGLWGAGRGAVIGGATGIGLGVLDKIRGT